MLKYSLHAHTQRASRCTERTLDESEAQEKGEGEFRGRDMRKGGAEGWGWVVEGGEDRGGGRRARDGRGGRGRGGGDGGADA